MSMEKEELLKLRKERRKQTLNIGDKVRAISASGKPLYDGKVATIIEKGMSGNEVYYGLYIEGVTVEKLSHPIIGQSEIIGNTSLLAPYFAEDLELVSTHNLTAPETKPTEEVEAKELNLCELIGDRDGIHVYCPTCGEVTLQAWSRGKNTKPLIFAQNDTSIVVRTFANGKAYAGGECIIYPSRVLYEKYPLDAKAAWDVWEEEQKKYHIEVIVNNHDNEGDLTDCAYVSGDIAFRTPSDRDHCIVKKSEVKDWVENASQFMPTSNLQFALKCGAKKLFGTDLFKERSEK